MKNLKLMMITLMMSLMTIVSFGQSLFKNTTIFNEFGDSTSSILRNVSHGFFSNTATNNSELEVYTDLSIFPKFNNIEEYIVYQKNNIEKSDDLSKEEKEKLLKQVSSKIVFNIVKETIGSIIFKLYEYKKHNLPHFISNTTGKIKVKIDNDIITANLPNTCFQSGKIVLMAYHSESSKYVKQQIKYGLYDYNLTIIYNSILQSKKPVEVVIYAGSSIYNFTIK
jgi:hypothetical protein